MTLQEIFTKLAGHMIQGLMTHEQFSKYYDFLNLKGFKRLHAHRYIDESVNYIRLSCFYMKHFNKLIEEPIVDNPSIIPSSWYKYSRFEVDNGTKQKYAADGIETWKKWEASTRDLYKGMYKELTAIEEYSSAEFVKELMEDVECEIASVDNLLLDMKAHDYSLDYIVNVQEHYSCLYDEVGERR